MRSNVLKFVLVCLLCLGLVTALALLIEWAG